MKRLVAFALALVVAATSAGAAEPGLVANGRSAAAVTAEQRYVLSAAIRPLLFWVSASNVGDARIVWRHDGSGRRGYELLLGSDPARAPRRINRWGFVREDADASVATMIGVMNRSEDATLDQAKAGLQSKDGFPFKVIRARIEGGSARAESTTLVAGRDFTFRQLDELLQFAEQARVPPRVRSGRLPERIRPGLLFALADLVDAGVAAARTPQSKGPQPQVVQYTFNTGVYDLVVRSWKRIDSAQFGKRTFSRLVRLEFESRNLATGGTERFVFVCGTEGALAGVPVFIRYQPKWWFKVEGVLGPGATG